MLILDPTPGAAERAGLEGARLAALADELPARWPDATALLVARGGRLVFEHYTSGGPDDLRDTQSVTKALLAALVGVARGSGALADLDERVLPFFPDLAPRVNDARWADVTLRHLLTMTSGLPSELADPAYDDAWFLGEDPIAFALAQDLRGAPGEAFRYSNAGAHLLGEIVARATGRDLAEFLDDALLRPIGARRGDWPRDPRGRPFASGSAHLTARDLARFGQLVLSRGAWGGARVLDPGWVEEMTRPRVRGDAGMEGIADYGFLWWWTREGGAEGWYATGFGGQYVAVFPELDLVAVMTGRVDVHPGHREVIPTRVLPAVR